MSLTPEASSASATPAHIDLALVALREITPPKSIGDFVASRFEEGGILTMRFENKLPGYPGWQWNVSLALLENAEPTVLEAELLPEEGALLAPDWVPWSVRLAEFLEAQKRAAEAGLDMDEDAPEGLRELAEGDLSAEEIAEVAEDLADDVSENDDDLDVDDLDDEDDYPFVRDNVHSGDIDGVELDEDAFNEG